MKQSLPIVAALCLAIGPALADERDAGRTVSASDMWLSEPYPYLVVDQALSDTFSELGRNLGVAIEVSDKAGKKRAHRYGHDGSSGEFLTHLASEHALDWVIDNGRLFVSSLDERLSRSWSGNAGVLDNARAALADAGMDDPRFPLGVGSGRDQISLSAPPRYMAMAAPVIERVLAPRTTQTVNVIHGRARAGGT